VTFAATEKNENTRWQEATYEAGLHTHRMTPPSPTRSQTPVWERVGGRWQGEL
jgi:hypothetical protein